MNFTSLSFALIFSLSLIGCTGKSKQDDASTMSEKVLYTCPMHPSVIKDGPGACPICGMTLVRKTGVQELHDTARAQIQEVSLSPTQRMLANVSTAPAVRKSLLKDVTLVGIVDVAESHQATVSARFRGRIERLFVSYTGERVSKGQPLFELYSPDLVTSEQEFILSLDGQPNMVAGMRERLRLHFGMTLEQIAEVERTRTVKTTITFHSPIQGTVILKGVQEGEYVDEGTVLYQLADLSTVWIHLDVYEKDLPHIRVGQTVHITNEAYPDDIFSGRVTFIDPVMNPETRTARVRTEFSNKHGKLKPQMYVTAKVSFPSATGIVIPSTAVLATGKRSVVWIEVGTGAFEPREVILGMETDSEVQILEGLEAGDMVAATGGFLLDSESALRQSSVELHPPGHAAQNQVVDEQADHSMKETPSGSYNENDVTVVVKGDYTPSTIRVKFGKPVTLRFKREEKDRCTEEVVFEELNIRRHLPAFQTTSITFTPKESGEINFACGMGMVHGKLIVEP